MNTTDKRIAEWHTSIEGVVIPTLAPEKRADLKRWCADEGIAIDQSIFDDAYLLEHGTRMIREMYVLAGKIDAYRDHLREQAFLADGRDLARLENTIAVVGEYHGMANMAMKRAMRVYQQRTDESRTEARQHAIR